MSSQAQPHECLTHYKLRTGCTGLPHVTVDVGFLRDPGLGPQPLSTVWEGQKSLNNNRGENEGGEPEVETTQENNGEAIINKPADMPGATHLDAGFKLTLQPGIALHS